MKISVRTIALILTIFIAAAAGAMPAHAVESVFPPSESYASGEYFQKLLEVEKTGDPRVDLVNIALSQVGYREGGMEGEYSGKARFYNNYTEYGRCFGDPDCIWCTTFVWWCARQAGLDRTVFPDTIWPRIRTVNCPYVEYSPTAGVQPGDILFVENTGDSTTDHLAIVTEVTDSRIITVEGNCGNMVCQIAYERNIGARADGHGTIMYIGYLNFENDPSIPDASSLGQYVLITEDTGMYNKHTSGIQQGTVEKGRVCTLLAVRSDYQWYQIEFGDHAYWVRSRDAIFGSLEEMMAENRLLFTTTTTTTTTSAATTTTADEGTSVTEPVTEPITEPTTAHSTTAPTVGIETTEPTASETSVTTTAAETTTQPPSSEATAPSGDFSEAPSWSESEEEPTVLDEWGAFMDSYGRERIVLIAAMLAVVLSVFTILLVVFLRRDRRR